MDETIEITSTDVKVDLKDKFVIGAICLVAGVLIEGLVERGYYSFKARRQIAAKTAPKQ
jgi:hypothetical protein